MDFHLSLQEPTFLLAHKPGTPPKSQPLELEGLLRHPVFLPSPALSQLPG